MQFLNADLIFFKTKFILCGKLINIVTAINHISLWLSSLSLAIPRPAYCQAC